MITELTEAQRVRIQDVYREWVAVGHNCEPIYRRAAREIVVEFYKRLGKPAPAVLFFSSPMMWAQAHAVLRGLEDKIPEDVRPQESFKDQLRAHLRDQLGDEFEVQFGDQFSAQFGEQFGLQLVDQLNTQLEAQLRAQVEAQLEALPSFQISDHLIHQLEGHLRHQVSDQIWNQLWDELGAQLGDQLGEELRAQLRDQIWSQLSFLSAQHVVALQAFYRFCEEIGVRYTQEQSELLDLWVREARTLGWWMPCESVALIMERHTALHLDELGRLHSESGMACEYSDGWGVYAWHGLRVPEWIIRQPEKITVPAIQQESNAEIRRVMLERFGLDRFLRESDATLIHRDTLKGSFPQFVNMGDKREFLGYIPGTETISLYELPVKNAEDYNVRVVHVVCPSTMRDYVLGVDTSETRAVAAVASTFGLSEKEYREGNFARQGDVLIRPLGGKWPEELRGRHS